MYGWRSRIGLIIPSDNTSMESEFNKILYPVEGISVHATRIFLEELSVESLLKMKDQVKRAAKELKTAEITVIAYGCTSGSFIKGLDFDKEIIREIEEETHITATTTSTAVVEALKKLNVKKIAVGTPYSDDVNEKEKEFLGANGFDVTTIAGLNIIPIFNQGLQEPYVAYNLGEEIDSNKAECIFISCTDIRAVEIIDALERRLGKPVISSNLATLWHVLRIEQLGLSLRGYGKLLEEY
jgi:maleate isomerase